MPIADDWKAIRDRLREIKAEESPQPSCPVCKGAGWTQDFFGSRARGYVECVACRNLTQQPKLFLMNAAEQEKQPLKVRWSRP